MKILHVIQSAEPDKGGPIEGICQLGVADTTQQHEVVSLDSPHSPVVNDFPLPIYAIGPGTMLGYSPRLVPWLLENGGDYDLVVINGLWRYASYGSWRALRRMNVPYIVMPHGMLDPWFKHAYPLKHLKKWLFWPWTEYRVLRDAAAVVFTCEEERRLARDSFWLYRAHERVGTYGTGGIQVDRESALQQFLARYPSLHHKRFLLFLGRIHVKKGCDLLIEAFADAASDDPLLHLVMAGPCHDDWATTLRNRADALGVSDRVIWTGMLTGNDKWGAFCAADAFILPSHQENFGVAVAEALSCGVPVLISNKVQIWREIEADGAGIVLGDTIADTRSLIRNWISLDTAAREQMRSNAVRCFNKRFELHQFVTKMGNIFEEAAA